MTAETFTALVNYLTKWFQELIGAVKHVKTWLEGAAKDDITTPDD